MFKKRAFSWYLNKGSATNVGKSVGTFSQLLNETGAIKEHFGLLPRHIIWLHHIDHNDYSEASRVLARLANDEKKIASRRSLCLSLSKLCAMASDAGLSAVEARALERQENVLKLQKMYWKTISGVPTGVRHLMPLSELVHGYVGMNFGVWGCDSMNTGVRGYEGTRVRGYEGTRTRVRGYEGTRVRGYEGTRVRGYEGTRVRGYEGTRVRGYEGTRVRGLL